MQKKLIFIVFCFFTFSCSNRSVLDIYPNNLILTKKENIDIEEIKITLKNMRLSGEPFSMSVRYLYSPFLDDSTKQVLFFSSKKCPVFSNECILFSQNKRFGLGKGESVTFFLYIKHKEIKNGKRYDLKVKFKQGNQTLLFQTTISN